MIAQRFIKVCAVSIVIAVTSVIAFVFGVARAPVVPLYLACCFAGGLVAGIALWFLVKIMLFMPEQLRTTSNFLKRFVIIFFLMLALCIVFLGQFLFFSMAKQKRFEAGLMLQGYGIALLACCLILCCFSLFNVLRDAERQEEQ